METVYVVLVQTKTYPDDEHTTICLDKIYKDRADALARASEIEKRSKKVELVYKKFLEACERIPRSKFLWYEQEQEKTRIAKDMGVDDEILNEYFLGPFHAEVKEQNVL